MGDGKLLAILVARAASPRLDPLLKALGKLESALLREAPDHEISASSARPGCEREVTAALRPERGVRPMIGDDAKHER